MIFCMQRSASRQINIFDNQFLSVYIVDKIQFKSKFNIGIGKLPMFDYIKYGGQEFCYFIEYPPLL